MKTIMAFTASGLFLLSSCGPENIRYPDSIRESEIQAVLCIGPMPEPVSTVIFLGMSYMGQMSIIPSGKEEQKMKELLAASGFRNILLQSIKAAAPHLKGTISLEIIDNAFENTDNQSIAQAIKNKKGGAAGFSSLKIKSGTRYFLAVTVNRWGYYYNSYGQLCYFELELTAELININTGEVLWRRAPRTHDVIHVAPIACEPDAGYVREALGRAANLQMKTLIDHIKEKQ